MEHHSKAPLLKRSNLKEASLEGADLRGADLGHADIRGTIFKDTKLLDAIFRGANLRGAKNLTIQQLSQVKTLYQAKLDPDLEAQVKEKYPHLLEKPPNSPDPSKTNSQ